MLVEIILRNKGTIQQFQQAQEISLDNDRVDAINKAKRLSQETNRRRKLQLHKRQLQAKREEQRRHDILTRRKEEQRLATEKYQRSHLPPSARQNYRPMARAFGGTTLETALQLIRGGNPHNNRPVSSHERFLSLADENVDLLESSFNKLRPHSTRPGSGRLAHQLDPKERAELMNYSKQNLTASKTLFEQELEQQQSLLRAQHKQYLQEFNNAVNNEIYGRKACEPVGHQCDNNNEAAKNLEDILHSDSCSSVDSLDEHKSADLRDNKFNNTKHVMSQSRHLTVHVYHEDEGNINKEYMNILQQEQKQELAKQQEYRELEQQQQKQILTVSNEQNDLNNLQQRNINSFTLTQKNGSLLDGAKNELKPILDAPNYVGKNQSILHVAVANDNDVLGSNKVINGEHKVEQNYQPSLKQFSADSLDSDSSSSNISVLKLQGIAEKTSKASNNMYLQNTGNGNTFSMSNTNSNGITGINPIMYRVQHSENNNFSGQTGSPYSPNNQTKPSQVAWVSPQIESKATPTSGNEIKQANELFQLHKSSGISPWSGNSMQSQMPMSVVSTNGHFFNSGDALMSVTVPSSFPASLPARFVPNSSIYTLAGSKLDAAETGGTNYNELSKDLMSVAGININMNNDASYLDIMNSTFPQTDSQDYRNVSNYNQKQVQIYNCLSQTNVPTIGIRQAHSGQVSAADNQMNKQSSRFQNGSSAGPEEVNSVMHQDTQHYHRQWLNDNALTNTTPSYAGSNFPVSRPPSPVTNSAIVKSHCNPPAVQIGPQSVSSVSKGEIIKNTSTRSLKHVSHDVAKENIEGNLLVDDDSEDMRPLRGILKQNHARNVPHHQEKAPTSRPHVRDSLELAHLHNDKKSKKKSVRFAGHHDEDDNEAIEDRNSEKQNDINAGLSTYKTSFNRPLSTRTMSASNSETDIRVQRALSAGAHRQQSMVSEHVQIRNVQQLSSSSHPINSSEVTNAAYTNILQERSNLPTSFVNPVNTTPIHRPKAAAHIIMSTDTKNETSNGHNDTYTGLSSAYRSNLETKIKPVNNNFMSKVPVKIPASKESNTVVCNVAYTHTEGIPNSYTNKFGGNTVAEDSLLQVTKELPQQQSFDKQRNAYSSSKHVSNLAATASMVPASQKIPHPQYNGGIATFATSSNNVGYEKGGIRIDRTPTDDEITWLWDKVRNCLSRESGNKANLPANGTSDLGSRQPPTFSTKLIDGNTLELGANNSGASDAGTNVKARPGVFQPQTVPVTNPQNSVKAVAQPQGSYLRRYSLLKQRRANSASAIRNNTGYEGHRASGAVYGRNSTIPAQQTSSVAGQQQQYDIPTPMMYGYKPQNEVSESTAAFIIAERLAKQSLSDSQIQVAMEDAQSKQEAYNRSRMTIAKNGHSALSIEEQKLLESLDRLNEKLKAEPSFKTGMNHNQATQTQFPGFQGHRPIVDARRHMLLSPGVIQRAQSARSRIQTYLYR